jgi:N-acetylmuramoyl-L-alanine amidase
LKALSLILNTDSDFKSQLNPLEIHGRQGVGLKPFSNPLRNHWDERQLGADIKFLIIHSTKLSVKGVLEKFTSTDSENPVSSHYILPELDEIEAGFIVQVVPEEKKAWHAGKSAWEDVEWLNPFSIGIELLNPTVLPEKSFAVDTLWVPFQDNQIDVLGCLAKSIVQKYKISPLRILGHSDIAPTRKLDPGPLFPWAKLFYGYAVGAWLQEEEISNPEIIKERYNPQVPLPGKDALPRFVECLKAIGYVLSSDHVGGDQFLSVVRAFKAHFSRNQDLEGFYSPAIEEIDVYWAWALAAKYGKNF